jgi:hypothetical protein
MKRFNFLSMAVIAFLMVTAVSCTTVGSASDEGYANEGRRRVYVDPSYGQEVYLVKDPYTGRYYQVISPNGMYADPFSPFNSWNYGYGNRGGYGYGYPSRGNSNRPRATAPARTENYDKINEAKRRIRSDN